MRLSQRSFPIICKLFCVVTPRNLVEMCLLFREICRLKHLGKQRLKKREFLWNVGTFIIGYTASHFPNTIISHKRDFSLCHRRHLGRCVSPRSDPNTSPRPHLKLLATNPVISTFRFSAAEITRATGKPRSSVAILLFNVNICRCDDYKQHCRIDVVVASTHQSDVYISAGASQWRPDDRCEWRHTDATHNGHYIPPWCALKWTLLPPSIS